MLTGIVDESALSAADRDEAVRGIDALVAYVQARLAGVLDVNGSVEATSVVSGYDIPAWLTHGRRLRDHALARPVTYVFEYGDDQIAGRKDYFRRYGTDANALSKIVTRVSNVESLFRRRRTIDGEHQPESDAAGQDQFIRYTLSR